MSEHRDPSFGPLLPSELVVPYTSNMYAHLPIDAQITLAHMHGRERGMTTANLMLGSVMAAMEQQNLNLRERNEQLGIDFVTGLPTRRIFDEEYSRLVSAPPRERRVHHVPAFLAEHMAFLLDIDDFGQVNKTFGEPTGDIALRRVADAMRRVLRRRDIEGRYGGEELGAILPRTTLTEARDVAERVRIEIMQTAPFDRVQNLTVSIGVGRLAIGPSLKEGLAQPVTAMRAAKRLGKNRVLTYDEIPPEMR